MKPREDIFTESTLDILVPSGIINCIEEEVENIFIAKPRDQAFYDSGINDKENATTFFQQFEIFVEASIIDPNTLSTPTPAPPAVYRLPPSRSHGSSAATSPSSPSTPLPPPMDKRPTKQLEGTVIFSYLYNPNSNDRQMVVIERNGSWSCIIPLAIPVAYVKTRAQTPALALNSVENFGMMNLLEGLSVDPSFESSSSSLLLPTSRIFNSEQKRLMISIANNPPLVRKFRKILSVKSALNVRMRTTSVSPLDHVLMMSVELENNTDAGSSFSVEAVKVEIAHGFVTRFDWEPTNKKDKFPLTLNPVDQVTFLYSITILDDPTFPKVVPQFSPNTRHQNSRPSSRRTSVSSVFSITSYNTPITEERQRHVSIVAKGSPIINGVKNRSIESRWNCMLDLSNLRRREDSFPLPIPNHNNTNRNFYPAADVNPRFGGNKRPSILDHDSMGNGILSGGRAPRPMEMEIGDGLVLKLLLVNTLQYMFTLLIDQNTQEGLLLWFQIKNVRMIAIKSIPIPEIKLQNTELMLNGNQQNQLEPFTEEADFIKKYFENETPDADIVCLENNVRIG
ncbi:6882_t:CDS:10 [Diversispora eburnea]|uniref:6882_t:CDS:1 n=1 Tax=Diversispora eburnea TaxID=1213867 RepID=A0A9N8YKZ7_9GLOM|nr:6882_t:CDS:10 [Diversispora eburnea]